MSNYFSKGTSLYFFLFPSYYLKNQILEDKPVKDVSFISPLTKEEDESRSEVMIIPWANIRPDPEQPRTEFDEAKLDSLSTSIAAVGQMVPILVKGDPLNQDAYIIVDGERRWRACEMIAKQTMKAIEVYGSEEELFRHSVIANANREGLNVMDTVRAVAKVKSMTKGSNEEVASYFGQSRPWVDANLSILRLPEEVHKLMSAPIPAKKRLSFSVALLLVALPAKDAIELAYHFFYKDIKFNRAKQIIAQKRNELRMEGVKKVKPYSQYRMISRFCRNLADEADLIIDQPQDHFRVVFQTRPPEQITELIDNVERGLESLQALKDSLIRERERKSNE